MTIKKEKGFTLVELIAVLVILTVITLIVIPFILNIIRRVRDVSNKRSVDGYGRATELSISNYLIKNGRYPKSIDDLTVKYSDNEVICNINIIYEDGSIYLSKCTVKGTEVKDSKTEDGWYHYGKRNLTNEEYVEKYGDALTSAVSEYKKTNDVNPPDLDSLTIKYEAKKEVNCSLKIINYDGSIYLSECKVNNVDVKDTSTEDGWYHYGEKKFKPYKIGDQVTYNDMDFYVIANSDETNNSVTLLKAEPLTVEEVNIYGVGHVNMYVTTNTSLTYYQKAYDSNGYGGMAYYSSATCGYNGSDGCTTDYDASEVKYAVDGWATDKINVNDLKKDSLGYKTRLLTYDELINNLGYDSATWNVSYWKVNTEYVPTWVYNSNYWYWTMSPNNNSFYVWRVGSDGNVYGRSVYDNLLGVVRPVVTLLKSAL